MSKNFVFFSYLNLFFEILNVGLGKMVQVVGSHGWLKEIALIHLK